MAEKLVTGQQEFDEFCIRVRDAGIVAFDTEFISENTFRPVLCLIQLAIPDQCVAIDPFEIDVSSWWEIMADDRVTVVAHAAREEIRFCLNLGNRQPVQLVDVQLAEGLRSSSYPLSYERLISRVLDKTVHSAETRTDWSRRPLTDRQITYAIDDVRFLLDVWQRQKNWLTERGRLGWAEEEFDRLIDEMANERSEDRWTRLSGVRRLRPRQLAVARELFQWRDAEAERRDQPARRILRDDLLVDLARRQPKTEADLLNSRDMNRSGFRRNSAEIVRRVKAALELPRDDLPKRLDRANSGNEDPVISRFLAIALANRCAELGLSAGLVGTANDLKDLVRWHNAGRPETNRPKLNTGWRAEVCGDLLRDVLRGQVSVRVGDPDSDHPLLFEHSSD